MGFTGGRTGRSLPVRWLTALTVVVAGVAVPVAPAYARSAAGTAVVSEVHDVRSEAKAQAIRTGRHVGVPSLTTDDSTTTANPDGSFSTLTTARPTRMRGSDGSWEPIDATLRRGSDGSVRPVATPNALVLSGGGRGPLASVSDGAGHVLGVSVPVQLPVPAVSGGSATYPNVYPGVDLVATAQPDGGFGEVFVVRDAAAAARLSRLRLDTDLRGLSVREDAAGGLRAVDPATGALVAEAPAPQMWDSADPSSTAVMAGRSAHVATVPVSVDRSDLTLAVDVRRLGANPTYPLYVDPTWTLPYQSGGTEAFDQVQSGCPTSRTNDGTDPLGVGYNDFDTCVGAYETFFKVDTSNVLDASLVIQSATLKINEVQSAWNSCGQGSETISIYTTTSIASAPYWNDRPQQQKFIVSKPMKSVGNKDGTMCAGGSVPGDFNVLTAVNDARAGNAASWTFGMYGNETAGSHSLERFNSNPSVLTVYDIKPNAPTNLSTVPIPRTAAGVQQPCAGSGTGYLGLTNFGGQHIASLSAKLTSPVSAAQMNAVFSLHDVIANTTSTPTSSGYVTTGAYVSVSTPVLGDGHTYQWLAHASDQYYSSPNSSTCQFVVDQTVPTSPQVSQDGTDFPPSGTPVDPTKPRKYYGDTGNVKFTASDPNPTGGTASGLGGFYYSLDVPIPATGATRHPATNGSLTAPITPAHWGTTVLYIEAYDNAGNVSGQTQYDFYVPWRTGTTAVPGDVSGDGVPDFVTASADGHLVEYEGDQDPAAPAVTLSSPTYSPGGQETPWNDYLVTHRGSFTNQTGDDLWAYDKLNHNLYVDKNNGSNSFNDLSRVVQVTKSEVINNDWGGCVPTASTGTCSDFDTSDWSTLTQVLAVGDLFTGSASQDSHNGDLLTVEGGHLWLYRGWPSQAPYFLDEVVELGTSGWNGMTLIAPGLVNGKPTLWARNNSTGKLYSYPITFDSNGYPVGLGAAGTGGTALTLPGNPMLDSTDYPSVVSPGDLHQSGNPDLVVTTSTGTVIDYPGAAATAGGLATFGTPVTLGSSSQFTNAD
jgi:hypothetical protein